MSIRAKIMEDIKVAMKARDQARMDAIRFLQAAIKNREIELRPNPIKEEEINAVIKKLAKQRKESIDQFQAAGRQDLVAKETAELSILEQYLPKAASKEETEKVVIEVIAALKATSIKDMGAVMKESVAKLAGTADNKLLSEIIKSKLS
ncbi:MAG: GatB/YqeY domain-containing protein [Bdellovibrionales bacterium]